MDTYAREQYMETLRETYLRGSKKEKSEILDEYCRNTSMDRKYVIKRFRGKAGLKKEKTSRKKRKEKYDGSVKAALAKVWRIFDYPCGQRCTSILRDELDRLVTLGEVSCSEEVIIKLKKISSAEIDRSLAHEKEVIRQKNKYTIRPNRFLCSKVPTKTSAEIARDHPGRIQIDCVEHCGTNAAGEYLNSLTTVDIFSGWWEGAVLMGKGQERALVGIHDARERSPFSWLEIHPDNGGNIMNYSVYAYAEKHHIEFSRSRPYKKNDNCFVEQKNSTHVRKVVGYLRYDTEEEQAILSDLYCHELRLYKNFFQPVMKLVEKQRVGGKIRKKYDVPKTPYRRLMECTFLTVEQKDTLLKIYENLNPAELKRKIDLKREQLYVAYQKKNGLPVEAGRNY